MKPIKITAANETAIENELRRVNGKAEAHSYTTIREIESISRSATSRLNALGLPKKLHVGAVFVSISGDRVSNAYSRKGYERRGTKITIERRATGWFLNTVEKYCLGQQGGSSLLILTDDQDAAAVDALRSSYRLSPTAAA